MINMLSQLIRAKVEERFGKSIRYAKDCEVLAMSIYAFTNEKISTSTVKRLFGIIEAGNEPRLYTLDILAKYLGYHNYDHLLQEFNPNRLEQSNVIDTINVSDLKIGDSIRFKYSPNKYISACYIQDSVFKIIESNDPKILKDELLMFNNLGRHLPLFASWRSSRGLSTKNIVLGKISGITSIERLMQ
jgi:hypothetical protein